MDQKIFFLFWKVIAKFMEVLTENLLEMLLRKNLLEISDFLLGF